MAKLTAAALGCASILALAACQTPSADAVSAAPETAPASTAAAAPAATNLQQVSAPDVHPGEAVYKQACATCHDNAEATRSPSRDNLKGMSFQFVNYALTQGKMKDMAASLTPEQRGAVVSYVTGRDTTKSVDWTPQMMCTGARAAVDLEGPDAVTSAHFG